MVHRQGKFIPTVMTSHLSSIRIKQLSDQRTT